MSRPQKESSMGTGCRLRGKPKLSSDVGGWEEKTIKTEPQKRKGEKKNDDKCVTLNTETLDMKCTLGGGSDKNTSETDFENKTLGEWRGRGREHYKRRQLRKEER